MNNSNSTGTFGELNPDWISPDTTGATTNEYDAVERVYLPMFKEGALSKKTLWEKTPKVDANDEEQRITEEEEMGLSLSEDDDVGAGVDTSTDVQEGEEG